MLAVVLLDRTVLEPLGARFLPANASPMAR
jgi:hypothetical protein